MKATSVAIFHCPKCRYEERHLISIDIEGAMFSASVSCKKCGHVRAGKSAVDGPVSDGNIVRTIRHNLERAEFKDLPRLDVKSGVPAVENWGNGNPQARVKDDPPE